MKRVLSGILSLVMVLSLTPSTIAFAEDDNDADVIIQEDSQDLTGGANSSSPVQEEPSGEIGGGRPIV